MSRKTGFVIALLAVGIAVGILVDRGMLTGSKGSPDKVLFSVAAPAGFKPAVPFEMYAAATTQTPNLVEDKIPPGSDTGSGAFWRAPSPAITSADISYVDVLDEKGKCFRLRIVLSYDGGDKFQKLAADQLHKRIAIYLNGKLWMLPQIVRPTAGRAVNFALYFRKLENAENMAEALVGGQTSKDPAALLERASNVPPSDESPRQTPSMFH